MQTASKDDEHLYFICALSHLFSTQLKIFFHKKIKWQCIPHGKLFFPLAYAIQNTAHITEEGISQCYFYWYQLVRYYIFWDSLCAVINIPGYHSNQHLFNIYLGSELKIIKKKKKTTHKQANLRHTPRKTMASPNHTARLLQGRWEYWTWYKVKGYNFQIRLFQIKYTVVLSS